MTLLVLVAPGRFAYSQPEKTDSVTSDRAGRVARWLDKADEHHRSGAYHLEAEGLEKALALLEPGDPLRNATAARLIRLYRGALGRFERAAEWVHTLAEELRPTPEGVDALFELADTEFNHGRVDQAYQTYREILGRIMAPDPPWDRFDKRCWPAWHGEQLCRYPKGTDPLFPPDLTVSGQLGQLLQQVRSGNWIEAGSLLDRNLALQSPIEWKPEPKTWISAREWLERAIQESQPGSLRLLADYYQDNIDALIERGDWKAMAGFRFHHPIPALQTRLDIAIADRLVDVGLPALASLYYGLALERVEESQRPILAAEELLSRISAGEQVGSAHIPDLEVEVEGERRSLREWADVWQGTAPSATQPLAPVDFVEAPISRLPLIRSPLPLNEWQIRWIAREDVEWPRFAEEFIPFIPAGSPRSLILNLGTAVEAVDVVDGRCLWTFLPPEENSMAFPNQRWRTKKVIMECARSTAVALEGNRVFCNLVWGHHNTTRHAGAIVALRRDDGSMLWSTAQIPELNGLQMAGEPAVYRGVVVTLAWRPQEALPLFYVIGLSAETGRVLWAHHLFSGDSLTVRDNEDFAHRPLACGQPAIIGGVAYMNTGAGIIAAINVVDGSLVWAIQYPRLKAINVSDWAARMTLSRPAGIVAVFDDTVLFAPADSHSLLAVDRASGEMRHSRESLDLRAIGAADRERAYLLENTTIRAIRPNDAETAWQTKLPSSGIVGVPTLSQRGLWVPSWEGLFLLEPTTGEIIAQRSWKREEACGFIQDYGDRLVGASRVCLHVIADQSLGARDDITLAPEEVEKRRQVAVPSRADKWLRWAMACVNRGEFILSGADPEHMIMRSELIQMREIDPVPSLCWQRLSPLPWAYDVAFDESHVAVWDESHLFVLDATSGRTLWEDHLPEALGEPPGRGADLVEESLLWWGANQVHCYHVDSGQKRWMAQPGGSIEGVRPTAEGVGVYLRSGGHLALLLDWETGAERARIPIPNLTPAPRPPPPPGKRPPQLASLPALIIGRQGSGFRALAADVVFVNSAGPVRIDWEKGTAIAGETIHRTRRGEGFDAHLIVFERYAALRGRDNDLNIYHEPLIAVWDLESLSCIETPKAARWTISGDLLFTFLDHRLTCTDLRKGTQLWRSLTVRDHCRLMLPADDFVVLLTQDERWGEDDVRDVSYLRVFDIRTGEQVEVFNITKRWMHVLDLQPDRLLMWDITFLYNLRTSVNDLSQDHRRILIQGERADVEAIAALRMARDLEDPPTVEILDLAVPPRIDGDLSDWEAAEVRRLDTIMDWKPDFAHQSYLKSRGYGGAEDHSASIRIGEAGDSYYLAIEVIDDVHASDPIPGLWRSDSVTLYCARAEGAEVDPTMLTVALAGGVPRFELGTAAAGIAASDSPGYDPELTPGPRSFVLSPLVSAGSVRIPPGTPVEVAIERDEASGRTVYELKVARAAWPIDSGMFWDVIINDDDGHGREGGLQLASSVWGIEETTKGGIRGGFSE